MREGCFSGPPRIPKPEQAGAGAGKGLEGLSVQTEVWTGAPAYSQLPCGPGSALN